MSPMSALLIFRTWRKGKEGNKFETPAGRDHIPLVSLVKDSNTEPSSVYHKPKISPSIQQMLNRPGVKLLDYRLAKTEIEIPSSDY